MNSSNQIPPKIDSVKAFLPKSFAAVGSIMLLALVVQCWLVARTPISSIDSVRFISIAQSIDSQGLLSVLHTDREQPLFPLVVCGVQHTLNWLGVNPSEIWMRSTQVASILGILLAVPAIFLVARRMAGYLAAVVGTLAFVLLPEVARIGPDGVADAWQLALAAWAVALVFVGERKIFLIGAGLLVALALLVRVEVAVLLGAMLFSVLFFRHENAETSLPVRLGPAAKNGIKNAACFIVGLGLVLVPYLLACNTYQPRQAVSRLLGRTASREADRTIINDVTTTSPSPQNLSATALANVPGLATFSPKEPGTSIRRRGLLPAVAKVAEETADLFGYWLGLFAMVGAITLTRQREPFTSLDRFAWLLIGLLLAVITWFTAKEGYVNARHLLLLLIPSVSSIGVGILAVSNWLRCRFTETPLPYRQSAIAFTTLVLLVMTLSHLAPHRVNRSTYRDAGRWLARQTQNEATTGAVLDTRGWTSLFSTLPTYQAEQIKEAFADPRLEYVVVIEEEMLSTSRRSQTLRTLLDHNAKRITQFKSLQARRPTDSLIVYRLNDSEISERVGVSPRCCPEKNRELAPLHSAFKALPQNERKSYR